MSARADAVVVGSGAGGAPIATALAEAGLEVLVLEAGGRLETRDFDGNEAALLPRLMRAATASDSGIELYAGACVGGSTVVNDALCWRPPPEVLAGWREEHGLAGLGDAALAPYVERVWTEIGAAPTGPANLSRNARLLALGAERLGWAGEVMPRNARGCANLGLCNLGCPTGAKQSALVTWVPHAERAGARVVPRARVERVRLGGGRAQGVEGVVLDDRGRTAVGALRVDAPLVVLAAGVLETPALLLRSGIPAGEGVQFHSSVSVTARFAEPVHGFFGPTMAYAVTEFADTFGRRGPGFMLENVTVAPAVTAGSLPGFGRELERAMTALPHLARAVVVLRDRTRGRVALGPEGGAEIAYQPVAEDLARIAVAIESLARLYLAAGAEEVWLPIEGHAPVRRAAELADLAARTLRTRDLTLLYAVHLFGGACMGGDRARGPCDESGAVRGVAGLYVGDASALPGNTGVNPQVTIMANALRVAAAAKPA